MAHKPIHSRFTLFATAWVIPTLLLTLPASAADYAQTTGSALTFASKYDGEVFTGTFSNFSTQLRFDPANLGTATLDVTIALTSAKTGNADRDTTLQGSDFFNAAKFTQARYRASKFRSLGADRYAADGTLKLRGVSKPVTLNFTWAPGTKPVLIGKATVRRLDFGIGAGDWADTGTIPNEVAISTKVVFSAVQ